MVTWGAKELLKNTINTATFHNRILEENEMWKQWEKECGLTMMVSDDDILKKYRKSHQCSKHRKKDKSREREIQKATEMSFPVPSSSKDGDRWDHSGFKELYPDEDVQERPSSHTSKSSSSKHKKKKKRKEISTSDSEIWEEFKKYKRSKKSHEKSDSSKKKISSSFDSHKKEEKRHKERKTKS